MDCWFNEACSLLGKILQNLKLHKPTILMSNRTLISNNNNSTYSIPQLIWTSFNQSLDNKMNSKVQQKSLISVIKLTYLKITLHVFLLFLTAINFEIHIFTNTVIHFMDCYYILFIIFVDIFQIHVATMYKSLSFSYFKLLQVCHHDYSHLWLNEMGHHPYYLV